MNKTCCVTGHRDIPADRLDDVRKALQYETERAAADGYRIFISGFAQGVDLLFAEIVVELRKKDPRIFLEAALPYAGRLKSPDPRFQTLLAACNGYKIICDTYCTGCFMRRNRYS